MSAYPKVPSVFRQVRIRIRFDLSVSSDPYERDSDDLIYFEFVFESGAYCKDTPFTGYCPVLFVQPMAGFMRVFSVHHAPQLFIDILVNTLECIRRPPAKNHTLQALSRFYILL